MVNHSNLPVGCHHRWWISNLLHPTTGSYLQNISKTQNFHLPNNPNRSANKPLPAQIVFRSPSSKTTQSIRKHDAMATTTLFSDPSSIFDIRIRLRAANVPRICLDLNSKSKTNINRIHCNTISGGLQKLQIISRNPPAQDHPTHQGETCSNANSNWCVAYSPGLSARGIVTFRQSRGITSKSFSNAFEVDFAPPKAIRRWRL